MSEKHTAESADNASGAGMETKACLLEGGRYFADRVMGPDRFNADLACKKREDKSFVTELVSRTDATRLLAESQSHNAKLEVQVDRMREALTKIIAIENLYSGSDWQEIEEAREIASAALKP